MYHEDEEFEHCAEEEPALEPEYIPVEDPCAAVELGRLLVRTKWVM